MFFYLDITNNYQGEWTKSFGIKSYFFL